MPSAPTWPLRPSGDSTPRLGYPDAMASNVRSHAMLVIWLLVALLPLRGWAHAAMHLPAAHEMPASCHAEHAAAAGSAPLADATVEPAAAGTPAHEAQDACALCDVCHGAALPCAAASQRRDYTPPRVEHAPAVELGASRAPDRRPPRS